MITYDYYKNQVTHELYYNQKMFVEKAKDGRTTVKVEVEGGSLPFCVRKGVWAVREICGAKQFIPEGDPNYDEKAPKMVWGSYQKAVA